MNRAIILAGGKGTRLKPYTTIIPKPLVPIHGEMPILEIVLRQLKAHGFTRVTITVNHMADLIRAFFGDGGKWGLEIDYSVEDEPLGTIGALSLIPDLPESFLVMNGDILTDLNYADLHQVHLTQEADVTVAVYERTQCVDFGVLKHNDANRLVSFSEKPIHTYHVSMGVNVLSKKVVDSLKKHQFYGFDNLMEDGLKTGMRIFCKRHRGYWLDIGRPDDYDKANEDFHKFKDAFLV